MDEILEEVDPSVLADRFVLEVAKGEVHIIDSKDFSTSERGCIVRSYSGTDRLLNATAHVQALNDRPAAVLLADEVSPAEFLAEALPEFARAQRRAGQLARVDELMRVAVDQINFYAGQLQRATSLRERLLRDPASSASTRVLAENVAQVPQGGFRPLERENGSEAVVKDDAYWESLARDVRLAKQRMASKPLPY